mmetsp:Transcript_18709/g.29742  ORF Transcript_18709/g.29742 Transcript_18709/m.29742 type:complete len:309 (+) Transcript_18709:2694-3620(+)
MRQQIVRVARQELLQHTMKVVMLNRLLERIRLRTIHEQQFLAQFRVWHHTHHIVEHTPSIVRTQQRDNRLIVIVALQQVVLAQIVRHHQSRKPVNIIACGIHEQLLLNVFATRIQRTKCVHKLSPIVGRVEYAHDRAMLMHTFQHKSHLADNITIGALNHDMKLDIAVAGCVMRIVQETIIDAYYFQHAVHFLANLSLELLHAFHHARDIVKHERTTHNVQQSRRDGKLVMLVQLGAFSFTLRIRFDRIPHVMELQSRIMLSGGINVENVLHIGVECFIHAMRYQYQFTQVLLHIVVVHRIEGRRAAQ